METVRWWIDHYDAGIRYADDHVGLVIERLDQLGILDETLIMISADHGENQGELNVWGDHQTADAITCRVPLIVASPEHFQAPRVDTALHYQFDWAATLLELAGGRVPEIWDGEPFTPAFLRGEAIGRDFLVTGQGAWACQRGVRFDYHERPYMLLRTYHDGYKMLEDLMLFDLAADPQEQYNLAQEHLEVATQGLLHLENWLKEMLQTSTHDIDPMMTVLRQDGGLHTRGTLPEYLARLRQTGRAHHAETLARKHDFAQAD
jgi:arylsulfatase A-like enzyme